MWFLGAQNGSGQPFVQGLGRKRVARRRAAAVGDPPQESHTLMHLPGCGADMQLWILNPLWSLEELPRDALWRTRGTEVSQTEASEHEDAACCLAAQHTPASTVGSLHLTSGAPPQPAALLRWAIIPWILLAHHQGKPNQRHTIAALPFALREGQSTLGDVHLQRQQLLPSPGSTAWLLSLLSRVSLEPGRILLGDVKRDESWFN